MHDPFASLPPVPSFELTSADVTADSPLPPAQYAAMSGRPGAADVSPQLSWSGFPEETKSFVVTMFDPDAPTPSGFWHWVLADVPASVTGLASGATPPAPAFHVANDARVQGYLGAAPPAGTKHRYVIAVHALDVESVVPSGVNAESTPAMLSFAILGNTLARAVLVPWGGDA
ncbi:hypothetical protein SAMN05216553_101195 [Lentzea fradiae]|uniref:Phospholipid-binding protein, PBP family n=1 Tax=Lentzea fradiae TaxID=200378 RepID=A0A1G7KBW1_9PSEU|nr:YbhB/YbcL family Raf kinase inhibitor-like protein [Lentzea fradiae]SDF34675.1 hypothetical protein SAMN05216553_101195 [Lentzea fradiae]